MLQLVKVKCQDCGDEFSSMRRTKDDKRAAKFCTTCRYRRSSHAKSILEPYERKKRPKDQS